MSKIPENEYTGMLSRHGVADAVLYEVANMPSTLDEQYDLIRAFESAHEKKLEEIREELETSYDSAIEDLKDEAWTLQRDLTSAEETISKFRNQNDLLVEALQEFKSLDEIRKIVKP